MKKWIAPLLVLLTALVLTALGFLPALAGALQDAGVERKVSYRPLHSVSPSFSEKGSGLSFAEKLMIICNSEISPIVPVLASMTEQQVRSAVEERLQPFVDEGLVRLRDFPNFHASPHIAISWQDTQKYCLFWSVTLVWFDGDITHTLNLRIDDETGDILDMNYYDPALFAAAGSGQNTRQERFARLWLEQAGLWEQARLSPPDSNTQQVQSGDRDFSPTVYALSSGAENVIHIHFYVASHGEFMMWLESKSG